MSKKVVWDYDVGIPGRKYAVRFRGTSERDVRQQAFQVFGVRPDMVMLADWEQGDLHV